MDHQVKLKSFNLALRFKNGFKIQRTFENVVCIDNHNGNTKFKNASAL
jgi:hypothetical protein